MSDIDFKAPGEFSDADIAVAAHLVKIGGALPADESTIASRLRKSRKLGLCRDGSVIVGVVSIKEPENSYRKRGFAKAKVDISLHSNAPEVGYVTVHKDYRGQKLGQRLVEAAITEDRLTCYATTDDSSMKTILSKVGFSRQGHEWEGARGKLSLWTM